ncbi:MAG: tetratricopeptide repeat protein [Candidatus Eisenbacteria sp.]|nr:tetratricopeptide repeat protein [Candidatus Eisenbacteria bacterium]
MLLVLVMLGSGGCAYYNTFFYAKKYYAKAQRLQEASTTDRLSPEAVRYYDLSIEKCTKVIVSHGGGWRAGIDDALFLMGQCYFGKREYETAIGRFNDLVLNYPESDHATKALFYTGMSYQHLRNFGTASQIFGSLLREHPDFERRDEILFIDAEALETTGNDAEALRQYRRIITEFPDSEKREEALKRVGEIHFEEGNYDSAGVAFAELAAATRDDDVYFEAQLMRGASLVRRGEYDEAISIYVRILPVQPERDERGGRVWLAMAEAYNRAKRHDQALEKLALVIEHFENRALEVEALFLTGYTHEVYLHQYEEARTAYESTAARRTRSVFQEQASRRLENLRYLIELEAVAGAEEAEEETDRDRRAEAALRVAEFTLFESGDPGEALAHYRAIARDYPGSEAGLRAAFAHGWILCEEYDSVAAAQAVLADLIETYPASNQAKGALDLLEMLEMPPERRVRLSARVDSARAVEQFLADSIAAVQVTADSLARAAVDSLARAVADSLAQLEPTEVAGDSLAQLAPVEAAGDSLAQLVPTEAAGDSLAQLVPTEAPGDSLAQATADSLAYLTHADSLAMIRRADAIADSLIRRSRRPSAPAFLRPVVPERDSIAAAAAAPESFPPADGGAAADSNRRIGESSALPESLAAADSSRLVGEEAAASDSSAAGAPGAPGGAGEEETP